MKISPKIKEAIEKAVEQYDSIRKFAQQYGCNHASISKYLNGSIKQLTPETWERLSPYVTPFLPDGYTFDADKPIARGRKKTKHIPREPRFGESFVSQVMCQRMDCVFHDLQTLGFQCGKLRPLIDADGRCESYIQQPSSPAGEADHKED